MSFLDLLKLLSAPFRLPVGAVTLLTVGPVTFLVASGGVVVGSIAVSKTFGTPVRSIDPDAQLFIDAAQGIFTSLSAFSNPFLTSDTLDKIFDNENSKSPEVTFSELEKFNEISKKPDFIDEKTYKTIKKAFDTLSSTNESKKDILIEEIRNQAAKENLIPKCESLTNTSAKDFLLNSDKKTLETVLSNKETYEEFREKITGSKDDKRFHQYLKTEMKLTQDQLDVILARQNDPSSQIKEAHLSSEQLSPPISRHQ